MSATFVGRGALGIRIVATLPRDGSFSPWKKSTSTITMNGRTSGMPWSPCPPLFRKLGTQESELMAWIQDCDDPMSSAAMTVIGNDVKRPISDAASAGTMSRVTVIGLIVPLREAKRIPNPPASTVEATQLTAASRLGLYPRISAPRSFSAAARVASPNLVYLKTAQNAAATAQTRRTRMTWAWRIAIEPMCHDPDGRIGGKL